MLGGETHTREIWEQNGRPSSRDEEFWLQAETEITERNPHGGDHERRKYIAQKLKLNAKRGNTTLTGLRAVAQATLQDLTGRTSA